MERVSVARTATVKSHGWVDAALEMGGLGPSPQQLTRYQPQRSFNKGKA